jgi:hypothetical protein
VRKTHLAPLRHVCRTCTLLWKKLDRFGAELVAIAGSTCSAVNAKARHVTQDKLPQRIARIDEPIATSLTARDRNDPEEARGTGGGAHAAALAAKSAALQQRQLRSEGVQAQLRAQSQAQGSLPAPESRSMHRGTGRGTAGCYNVQTAVAAKHPRIVACEVPNAPGDRAWLSPMARHAKAGLAGRCDAVADMGDSHGHEGKGGLEAGLMPSVSRPRTSAHEQRGLCSTEDCT